MTTRGGEWLYKQDGLIYGPVPASVLLEKVAAAELTADSPVSRVGGGFVRLGDEPAFAMEVARLTARLRVEAEARTAAEARRRRRLVGLIGGSVGGALLLLAAVAGVVTAMRSGLLGPSAEELAALQIAASPASIRLSVVDGTDEEFAEYDEDDPRAKSRGQAPRKRAQPAAKAAQGGAAVAGGYDRAAIQAVLAKEQSSLFPCLKEEAARDATFRGELPFTFTVGNDGTIVRLWVDRPGYHKGPLYECMRKTMARWRFPAFAGERPSVSLSFRVGS